MTALTLGLLRRGRNKPGFIVFPSKKGVVVIIFLYEAWEENHW